MKEYHRKIIDQLDSLLENNPKKYWSLLEDIANKTDNNNTPDITAGHLAFVGVLSFVLNLVLVRAISAAPQRV
jgi:hypothetical protein